MFGLAVGINDVAVSIYICENFKPAFRGVFGSIAIALFYGGFLVEICWVNLLSYGVVAYTNVAFAFLALSSILVSTESAQYLITRGEDEKAFKNFLWLRGTNDTTDEEETDEFRQLKQYIEDERKEKRTIVAYLSTPVYRKTLTIVLIFSSLTMATGFAPIMSFVSIALTEDVPSANEYTLLFGALQFGSAIFGSTIIEKVDRHTILITSSFIAAILHACTAVLFYLDSKILVPYFSWCIFATITLYAMTFSSGILTIFYTTRGELLPHNTRSFGGSLAIMAHSMVGSAATKVFLFIADAFGMYWNFVLYSIMSLVSVLFVYFILPETRGKSLVEIQNTMKIKVIGGK